MNGVPGVSATAGVFERNMYLAEDVRTYAYIVNLFSSLTDVSPSRGFSALS